MTKYLPFLAIFLLAALTSKAQKGSLVFNDSVVHLIEVEIDLPNWFDTLELDYELNDKFPDSFPEVYRMCDVVFDGFSIPNCGFREKGNTSNKANADKKKKPFKIAFDEFDDQEFDDLKKLNLNNGFDDPSLLHEAAALKLMRESGIIAPRTAWAKLYVNGEYIGLYSLVENVDKAFLKLHFGGGANNDGNLYKTNRKSNVFFDWLGNDPQAYQEKGLKLNTNEEENDWSRLIDFIYFLNHYEGGDFHQKLDSMFDVQNYLKILAVEKCVRSWDSYWGQGNNFYLYEHPDGQIRWIPWDLNETFQDIKLLSNTRLLDSYLVPTDKFDLRPLLQRVFENEDWHKAYLDFVCNLQAGWFSVDSLGPYLLHQHELVANAYYEEPNRWNSYESFETSLTEDHINEISPGKTPYALRLTYPGIFPFIAEQREWISYQLKGWEYDCQIEKPKTYTLAMYPNPADQQLTVASLPDSSFDYAEIVLLNSLGQLVFSNGFTEAGKTGTEIEVANLPAGFYVVVKRHSNGDTGTGKLVVR